MAVVLAAGVGAATLTTEVVADTTLQRSLDPAVFAAYGPVVPACVAGIAGGAPGFVRPAVSGPQPGRRTWLTQPSA